MPVVKTLGEISENQQVSVLGFSDDRSDASFRKETVPVGEIDDCGFSDAVSSYLDDDLSDISTEDVRTVSVEGDVSVLRDVVEKCRECIEDDEWSYEPIFVDSQHRIFDGHKRLSIMKHQGENEIEVWVRES